MSDWLDSLFETEEPAIEEPVAEVLEVVPPDEVESEYEVPTSHHAHTTPIVDTAQRWSFNSINPRRTSEGSKA